MRTKLINKCNHLNELTADEKIIQSLPNEKQKAELCYHVYACVPVMSFEKIKEIFMKLAISMM